LFSRNLASITVALYCFTCVDATQSSRFYTFDKVPKFRVVSCLIALIYSKQNVGEYGLIAVSFSHFLTHQFMRLCFTPCCGRYLT